MTLDDETGKGPARGRRMGEDWKQRVRLRAIDDCAEELILREIEGIPGAERDTALLSGLLCSREGKAISREEARDLPEGDRVLLLLILRRYLFGNVMDGVLTCPSCTEMLDVQLKIEDLIVASGVDQRARYEEAMEAEGVRFRVSFHVPTGGDVEKALRQGASIEEATKALARGCIESISRIGEETSRPLGGMEEWPDSIFQQVSARIEQLDPQAEIRLRSTCPACGCEFEQAVDPGGYLIRELAARQRVKYQEVHQLARAYHWSEAEILRMGSRKRRIYLDLLAAEYE